MQKLYFLSIFLLFSLFATAQSSKEEVRGVVRGVVTDHATLEPLVGVAVYVEQSNSYDVSDEKGFFEIKDAPVGFQKLKFNFLGYEELTSEPIFISKAQVQRSDVALKPLQIEIGAVKVEGRGVRGLEAPPVSAHKVSIQLLEKAPGGNRDVSKVVQNMPGVAPATNERNDLIVRGGGPNENKFYLDRIEIPVLNHFQTQGASGGNASIVNSDFLAGATLYTSAFPASRGGAVSSVLEMKMKEGNPDKLKMRVVAGASDMAVNLDTPISEKSTLLASYRISYLQLLFQMLELPFLPTYQDAQFKYTYKFDKRNKLKVIALGSYDINVLNTSMEDLEPDREQILEYLPENYQWSYVIGAVYTHLSRRGVLDVVVSTNLMNNKLQKWVDNNYDNSKTIDYSSNEGDVKGRVEYNTQLGNDYNISSGLSVGRTHYSTSGYSTYYINSNSYQLLYNSEINLFRYGLFGSLDKSFVGGKLNTNISLRLDGVDYSAEMANPLKQLSPRFSASYNLTSQWALNGNIGRYFQEPGYGVMGYRNENGVEENRDRIGYIASNQYTLGFSFTPNKQQKITTEGFYKGYSNYPMSMVDSTAIGSNGGDVFAVGDEAVTSSGKLRAYGVEVAYSNRDLWGCYLNVTYTYYYSEYRKLDSNLNPTLGYTPTNWDYRHILNIIASRNLGKGWEIGAKWSYAGGCPYTPYDMELSALKDNWDALNQPIYDYSKYNSERLPHFHQLDIRVDKSWYFDKWTLAVYVDIQNIYNYSSYSQDVVLAATDSNGNYLTDPSNSNSYLLNSYSNSSGGTIIPTFGVIIDF